MNLLDTYIIHHTLIPVFEEVCDEIPKEKILSQDFDSISIEFRLVNESYQDPIKILGILSDPAAGILSQGFLTQVRFMLFISDRIRRTNVNWILGSSRTINSAIFLVPDNPESRQIWRDPDIGSDRFWLHESGQNGWKPTNEQRSVATSNVDENIIVTLGDVETTKIEINPSI
ncbi:unnamed protein product [Rotaria socialis]